MTTPPQQPSGFTITINPTAVRQYLTPTNVIIGLLVLIALLLCIDTLAVIKAWSAYNEVSTFMRHAANLSSGNGF